MELGERGGSADLIRGQMECYRREGFPERHGLVECRVMVFKHTQRVIEFGNAWWAEQTRWSSWDQLSLPYLLWKMKMGFTLIPGNTRNSQFCQRAKHVGKRGV